MEDEKTTERVPKPIISKALIKHSSTYTSGNINVIGAKIKRKKVVFADRAQSLPLCTVFNYEQVEILTEQASPKNSSCACVLF